MGLKKPSGASFIMAEGEAFIQSPSNLIVEINNLSFTPNIIVMRCYSDYNGDGYQLSFYPFQIVEGNDYARGFNFKKDNPKYLSPDPYGRIKPTNRGFYAELNPTPRDNWLERTKCTWKAYYFPSLTEEAEKPF